MEQFDSSVEESSRISEQQQRNDEQQCPSCAAELTEASLWTRLTVWADQISEVAWLLERSNQVTKFGEFEVDPLPRIGSQCRLKGNLHQILQTGRLVKELVTCWKSSNYGPDTGLF